MVISAGNCLRYSPPQLLFTQTFWNTVWTKKLLKEVYSLHMYMCNLHKQAYTLEYDKQMEMGSLCVSLTIAGDTEIINY